jgi:hypothetical protein
MALSLLPRDGPELGANGSSTPRANQACISCRKQKRKCDKVLPSCSLCSRMSRACDYTDSNAPPTADDFTALQSRLFELETRLKEKESEVNSFSTVDTYESNSHLDGAVSSSASAEERQSVGLREPWWMTAPNKFPSVLFLDWDCFKSAQILVPKPSLEIPMVRQILSFEDVGGVMCSVCPQSLTAFVVEALHNEYSAATVIKKHICAVLCMRSPHLALILIRWNPGSTRDSQPWQHGSGSYVGLLQQHSCLVPGCIQEAHELGLSHTGWRPRLGHAVPRHEVGDHASREWCRNCRGSRIYRLQEIYRLTRVQYLQAMLLVAVYEYGHAIYPAAWMTIGTPYPMDNRSEDSRLVRKFDPRTLEHQGIRDMLTAK